jgi:hypothetical protein
MIVHASIPADRKKRRLLGFGANLDDIIKNDVTCSFGKGEDNVAGDVVGMLQERGFDPKTKTHVHPSTLKAFVKERIDRRQTNRPRYVRGFVQTQQKFGGKHNG